jgi:hydrogenase expression/formation protein HypC
MCLGIPGKVLETFEEHDILMGKVSFDGVVKKICLAHVPEAEPGEYVLVHVGFALSRIDEDHAREIFELLSSLEVPSELEEIESAEEST